MNTRRVEDIRILTSMAGTSQHSVPVNDLYRTRRKPLTRTSAVSDNSDDDAEGQAAAETPGRAQPDTPRPSAHTTDHNASVPRQLLFTTLQAAMRLQVPASWLRKKTAAGLIPHTRLGRHVRYSEDDLAAIIRDGAHSPHH